MDAIEQGQWTIEQSTDGSGAWFVLDADRHHVAKIHPREGLGDAKRIARLIAAAPELLAALHAAVEFEPHGVECRGAECRCWKRYAVDAIAKGRT